MLSGLLNRMNFNFNEFCKEKECEHYREWNIRAGKEGMVRCCNLVGMSFNITTFPTNCIHLEEITAKMKYEKEKFDSWKKLSEKSKLQIIEESLAAFRAMITLDDKL